MRFETYKNRLIFNRSLITAALLILIIAEAEAALVTLTGNVAAGQTYTINKGDTLVIGDMADPTKQGRTILGSLINNGYTISNASLAVLTNGEVRNRGFMQLNGSSWTSGLGSRKIVNEAGGIMIVSGYFDSYHSSGTGLENFGTLRFVDKLYGGIDGFPLIRNTIANHGSLTIEASADNCQFDATPENPNPGILNDGYFEVHSSGHCLTNDPDNYPTFTQTGGKTVINGTFGAKNLNLQNGVLSGSGTLTLTGNNNTIQFGGTISPGDDLGTLTVVNDLTIDGTIEMQLGGAAGNDKLVVNGNLNLDGARLYVSFREQYMLGFGQEVTLITADNITGYPVLASYPILPGNLGYELVQTATSIKMRISTKPR